MIAPFHFAYLPLCFVQGNICACPQSLNPNQQEDGQCPIRWCYLFCCYFNQPCHLGSSGGDVDSQEVQYQVDGQTKTRKVVIHTHFAF